MKKLITIAVFVTIGAGHAALADDFGARFSDQTPAAFGEVVTQAEFDIEALTNIEPAAGPVEEAAPKKEQGYVVRDTGRNNSGIVRIYPDPPQSDVHLSP